MKEIIYATVDANGGNQNGTIFADASSTLELGGYTVHHSQNTSLSSHQYSQAYSHDVGVGGIFASHQSQQQSISTHGMTTSSNHTVDIGGYDFGSAGSTHVNADGVTISNTVEIANHDYSCSVTCCSPISNLGVMSFFNNLPSPHLPLVDLSFVGNTLHQCPVVLSSMLSGLGACLGVIGQIGSAGAECLGSVANCIGGVAEAL